ncbi:MAG: hypothetical protein U0175_26280 [Caldilineaceae bacterium]
MNDVIEVIKKFHNYTLVNPQEINTSELYHSLSLTDKRQLVLYAIDKFKMGQTSDAEILLTHLACLTENGLTEFHEELVDSGILYPGVIYHNASTKISQKLISLLQSEKFPTEISNLLLALAWIGDQYALDAFTFWEKNPPHWANKLSIPLKAYTHSAGWEMTSQGSRRPLTFKKCFPLVVPTPNNLNINSAAKLNTSHAETCRWCKHELATLFDIDLNSPQLSFIVGSGERLRIATCYVCSCYGPIFTEVDWHGNSVWSEQNQLPAYLPRNTDPISLPIEPLVLSENTRSEYEAADQFMRVRFSQLGGFPTWIQDAEYPVCVKCDHTMQFIGQLSMEDINEYDEGTYYAFICIECGIACTNYQQS